MAEKTYTAAEVSNLVAAAVKDFVTGPPKHIHTCSQGHQWFCSSPYCETLLADCVDHGGQAPIEKGREPWRGGARA